MPLTNRLKYTRLPFPFFPEELTAEEKPYFQHFYEAALAASKYRGLVDPVKLALESGINLPKVHKDSFLSTYIWVAYLCINSEVFISYFIIII